MPRRAYHQAQAKLFARLALASRDPQIADRYRQSALDQMAKAEQVEPAASERDPASPQPARDSRA